MFLDQKGPSPGKEKKVDTKLLEKVPNTHSLDKGNIMAIHW